MKNKVIAYLIQAHSNPDYLLRLVNSLRHKDVSFFVHIDKKSDLVLFKDQFKNSKDIFFVQNRVEVTWKGFSQVKATMSLIDLALKNQQSFQYFVLLSGADYPIKKSECIVDFFKNTGKNYLEFFPVQESSSYLDYFRNKQLWFKISKWHFYDSIGINWSGRKGSLKNILYRIFILTNILFLNSFLKRKKVNKGMNYYFGSSWWSLNTESIIYIQNFYQTQSENNRCFEFSDAPDEMYFQTIILNSRFKHICINDNLRYIDWSKNREGPAILNLTDFKKIERSNALFARKIGAKSNSLIEKLDNMTI